MEIYTFYLGLLLMITIFYLVSKYFAKKEENEFELENNTINEGYNLTNFNPEEDVIVNFKLNQCLDNTL